MSLGKSLIVEEVSRPIVELTLGGWGHQRMEEERRRQDQDRMRSQMQFDTYASAMGGLGMAGADVPKGEDLSERPAKRERSEEGDDRRDDDEGKRFRGRDEE